MDFKEDHLYHIYNQGNRHQLIFFQPQNYTFFIEKMRTHLLPFVDIVAWCLMPNHFHFMAYVRQLEIEMLEPVSAWKTRKSKDRFTTLNTSIGVMLRSYTRAINRQEDSSGSLFRQKTKAQCLSCSDGVSPAYFIHTDKTELNLSIPEEAYPEVCFKYIHDNPVKANVVARKSDWKYSSFSEYIGNESWDLVNMERAKEFGLVLY